MTVFVSRKALDASWGSVADEDISTLYRDAIVRARMSTNGTRMAPLCATVHQLVWIAEDLDNLASGWLNDGNKENRQDALCMQRAAAKIRKALKRR